MEAGGGDSKIKGQKLSGSIDAKTGLLADAVKSCRVLWSYFSGMTGHSLKWMG